MRHEHKGKTSEGFLDSEKILEQLLIDKGMRILDIGSSSGHFSIPAAKIVKEEGRVFAVDIDGPALAELDSKAKDKGLSNITTIKRDFGKGTDIESDSIDLCFMINVVHGFVANEQWSDVLKEIKRVLREDGGVFIIDFKPESPMGPPEDVRISKDEMKNLMDDFKVEKGFQIEEFEYGLLFSKE